MTKSFEDQLANTSPSRKWIVKALLHPPEIKTPTPARAKKTAGSDRQVVLNASDFCVSVWPGCLWMSSSEHMDTSFRCGDKTVATWYVFCVFLFFFLNPAHWTWVLYKRNTFLEKTPSGRCVRIHSLHSALPETWQALRLFGLPWASINHEGCLQISQVGCSIPEFLILNILH